VSNLHFPDLEKKIKVELVSAHKSIYGHGPERMHVQIFKNMLLIKGEGCLTPLERHVYEEDYKWVEEARSKVSQRLFEMAKVEMILRCSIIKIITTTLTSGDIYILCILSRCFDSVKNKFNTQVLHLQ